MRRHGGIVRLLGGCGAAAALAFAGGTAGAHLSSAKAPVIRLVPQVRWRPAAVTATPSGGYVPAQLRAAYFVNPLLRSGINGKGQTIVIVDSFGSPTIASDLIAFDKQFKLANPVLKIIQPAGKVPKFTPTATRFNWAAETTLDVEWSHVMAPAARIVLVETPTSENEGRSGFPQIETAEKYVLAHHMGGVISQSFGATEQTFPKGTLQPLRGAYLLAAQHRYDVTVVSASGDAGATDYKTNLSDFYTFPVTSWPASDPLVTSVGGLDLNLNHSGGRITPDRVWNDGGGFTPSAGGGGKSIMFGRPSFQDGVASVVGGRRGVPDISLSASCIHSVDIYSSFDGPGGWSTICGTSEATPLFAGIIALADQKAGHPLGAINPLLYQMAAGNDPGVVDITRGDNSVTFDQGGGPVTVTGWNAVTGYDLASGLGTINARLFVAELAKLAG